ncbi:tRNA lysidine(34) synthetase TilS [bacterium AH-315-I20]|nr:tRNA lysidine(34) synthetase TilS [bacterium AH-315-I20]
MSNTDTFFNLPKQALKVLPNTLAVAWSGGADSTALLHYFKAEGYAVSAWHIDHGWSALSAKQVVPLAQRAEAWGIPFYCKTLQKPKQNIEAESRQLRYAAFSDLADETQCFNLVLGHHLEDQAETVCMRLLQGAGVAGCQGMRRVRKQGNLFLHRPFLHVKKAKIKQYLHAQDIDWLEDPSNQDVRIWRNKIRHQLFPMMQSQGVEPADLFLRYQKQAIKVQHNIEMLAGNHLIDVIDEAGRHGCRMGWQQWLAQSSSVRVYLLQKMIGILFADGKVLGRRHFKAIEQWRKHGANGWVSLSGCYLERQGESLKIFKGNQKLSA